MYDTIAGRVLAEFPWAAEIGLPAWPDAPFTAQNISTSAACSGCQRRTLQLRRCSGCRVCAYCSRECQVRQGRHGWSSCHRAVPLAALVPFAFICVVDLRHLFRAMLLCRLSTGDPSTNVNVLPLHGSGSSRGSSRDSRSTVAICHD